MERLDGNALCPCGSGKKYKKCCWKKSFQYMVDEKGKIYQKAEVKEAIVKEILEKYRKEFEETFGRKVEDDDPIFANCLLLSPEEYKENVTMMLEEIGVQPQIIYAFNKLGYTLVEGMENQYTTQQLKEWKEAIQEYYDLKKGKKKIEKPSLWLHLEEIASTFETLKLTYALIIRKFNDLQEGKPFIDIAEITEYVFFILTRNLKTMESIELLTDNHKGEDALSLIRSVYENYLQILMAVYLPEQLKREIEAKIGLLEGTYVRKEKSYNTLVEKASGNEIRLWTGARRATLSPVTRRDDLAIYQYLYSMLSAYTHPDIASVGAYVDEEGFSHWKRNFTEDAKLYLCYVNLLIFSELVGSKLITDKMKKDLRTYIRRVLPAMLQVFEELTRQEDIPLAFFNRLKSMNSCS